MHSPNTKYKLQPAVYAALLALCGLVVSLLVACSQPETSLQNDYLHPAFQITADELKSLVSQLPVNQQEAILTRPQVFLDLINSALDLRYEYTVLVDKQHGLSADFKPDDLEPHDKYPQLKTARDDLRLSAGIMPMVLALNEAAAQAGIELVFGSCYRSYRYQQQLFQRWVERLGLEQAERVSARAGHSQHQLGTVIDFFPISQWFAESSDYEWLKANAHRYGFSLSYPQGLEELTGYNYESWHWRYLHPVGVRLQREFFGNVQQHYLEFLHRNREFLSNRRKLQGQ